MPSSANVSLLLCGAALAALSLIGPGHSTPANAQPPAAPAPKPVAELPWWRQGMAHTEQQELFLVWMTFQFGSEWPSIFPDALIQTLWEYFTLDGYDLAA